ncbi:MAG: glycine cleavage system protein GcvH [Bacteroidaceae bacterium]|nr:glycine cleavage system protein GcvH [Bacteroidaceae bacterium]MBR4779355.1 glycine cleavage system protein GcvH [Bacteroidaceae bacterium]
MSKVEAGFKYAETHEWVKVEGEFAFIGISDYAQHELGDVVYVDFPDEGDYITKGEDFGAVESTKAASDLIAPVSGTVVEVNTALDDAPELINEDPYKNWMIKVKLADAAELDSLMDAAAYEAFCG